MRTIAFNEIAVEESASYRKHPHSSRHFRALSPEAELCVIENKIKYAVTVGGVSANTSRAYLNRTDLVLGLYPGINLLYRGHVINNISSEIRWSPARGAPNIPWPPKGCLKSDKFSNQP